MNTGGDIIKGEDAAARVAQLEERLAEAEADNGVLRLQLDMLTATDIVTGLPNSNGIAAQLQKAAARYSRSGEPFGLMHVGFPAFDRINEVRGHRALEEAMRHSGALVGAAVRQLDTVGRIDDDGLVCVMPMMSDDGVSPVVRRIEKVLDSTPIEFDDGEELYLVPAFTVVICSTAARVDPPTVMNRLIEARAEATPGTPVIRHASSS
ncbi:MAG: GGDEF domain-containing protein [bacterium]|nr:GGDEF domain-containing protein [bacterium]